MEDIFKFCGLLRQACSQNIQTLISLGNGCQFIEVTGSDRNVNGIYLRSNATRRSSFDDPEWKLSSRDQSRTRYIYKSGSGFSKKWAIGTERDKDMAFSNRYYAYKGVKYLI